MFFDLVINDLSYPQLSNTVEVHALMENFICSIKTAVGKGAKRELRLVDSIEALELSPAYRISNWRNDPNVSMELKSYLRSLVTKAPCLIDYTDLSDKSRSIDVSCNGKNSEALKAVYLLDGMSISLDQGQWQNHMLSCELHSLDDTDQLVDSSISIRNMSFPAHADGHSEWFEAKKINQISSIDDLKNNSPFNNIIFCDSAFSYLNGMSVEDAKVIQFLKKLRELDEAATKMITNDYSIISFRVTGESQSTMQKYGKEREFTCPDGNKRTFEDHFRITPGDWRCHILFNSGQKKFLVGYFGPHLSLA